MAEQKASLLSVTDTPEFKTAIAVAVAAEMPKIVAALKEGGGLNPGDQKWAESLAMAFASLTEQNNGRKYVPPEIIRERGEAREKMKQLIIAARKEGRPATYRVAAKTLLDNQVVEPKWVAANHIAQDTEIDWPGVPNDALVPLNDTAKEIHAAFLASIGSRPQSVLGAVPDALNDATGVTAGGLVVRGAAISRFINKPEGVPLSQINDEGLAVHHKNAPGRIVEKHVLGTIAPPARQTV